ncbi:Tyrosine-protein phosphatase OCA1 [Phytophthora megakarya]|uniref:Tyrosine-protein phosphatase OCA1 n=1 Tax=Phytophthora megakarya TaxID=4795 RepID=A0A225UKV6_9STRA|nr:Tyrosine-protein phosphatase OCA1 [Phytophthora megakarya]
MSYFIPPVNYGMIEEDLYRSGQPNGVLARRMDVISITEVFALLSVMGIRGLHKDDSIDDLISTLIFLQEVAEEEYLRGYH